MTTRNTKSAYDPIADIRSPCDSKAMIWWDWKTRQRVALIAATFSVGAIPCFVAAWVTSDWRLVIGAAFLFIPLIVGWMLYVGLATGRMPSAYGRSELRAKSPTWFWLTGSLYAGLLLLFLIFALDVVLGAAPVVPNLR